MKFKKSLVALVLAGSMVTLTGVAAVSGCKKKDTPNPPNGSKEITISRSGGYNEGAFVEFNKISNVTDYKVSYKPSGENAYKSIDKELVRVKDDKVRADVVGIVAGKYDMKIEAGNLTKEIKDITVSAHDRSGYAHFGAAKIGMDGVGGYKNDGTPKDNAEIIYVSEETKNTVSVTWGENEYTGICNILYNLKSAGHPVIIRVLGRIATNTWNAFNYNDVREADGSLSIENVKGINGKSFEEYVKTTYAFVNSQEIKDLNEAKFNDLKSKGIKLYTAKNLESYAESFVSGTTKYYTNWDLTGKTQNVQESEILAEGWNTLNDNITQLKHDANDALQNKVQYTASKASVKWSGDTFANSITAAKFDSSFNNCWIMGTTNSNDFIHTTFEGIGTDAELFQWGVSWKRVSSVEVRNLTFTDTPEDACAFEGGNTGCTDPDSTDDSKGGLTKYLWAHNNTFNIGKNYWDITDEQDKHEGDGATDLKANSYVTLSYNHYIKNHKTGLVGGGDSHNSANITYHHNFYDQCASRLPLARMANMHMYNNYYKGSTGYSMSLRSTSYAFVENCYFEGGKNPIQLYSATAAVKVIGCEFDNVKVESGYIGANSEGVERDSTVTQNCTYYGGAQFDINATYFYYDAVNKVTQATLLTTAAQAKTDCIAMAGVLK